MGVSTDGQLSFGINFDEEAEFPWMDDKYDHGIEDWWMDVSGYVNPAECPYADTETGYAVGFSKNDPRIDEWFKNKHAWQGANPVPIDEVYHCSHDYKCYILAVRGKHTYNSRGSATVIDPEWMQVPGEDINVFKAFLAKHGIETEDEPAWLLTSMWG